MPICREEGTTPLLSRGCLTVEDASWCGRIDGVAGKDKVCTHKKFKGPYKAGHEAGVRERARRNGKTKKKGRCPF